MPDYVVTLESAWLIRDVKSLDDAIGIAVSEAGKRLNPAAKFVEVEAGYLTCPYCEETLSSAIVVADTALVGLILEMKVFRGESKEHAGRIAKSVIGKALREYRSNCWMWKSNDPYCRAHGDRSYLQGPPPAKGKLLDTHHGSPDLFRRRRIQYCSRYRDAGRRGHPPFLYWR